VLAAYITGHTRRLGAPYFEVFRVSSAVTFCCYLVAHWQNWIGQPELLTFAAARGFTRVWLRCYNPDRMPNQIKRLREW
jgi:hypothetical protein